MKRYKRIFEESYNKQSLKKVKDNVFEVTMPNSKIWTITKGLQRMDRHSSWSKKDYTVMKNKYIIYDELGNELPYGASHSIDEVLYLLNNVFDEYMREYR